MFCLYKGKRKKLYGFHSNGSPMIKMNGTLVQVNESDVELPKTGRTLTP